MATAPGKLLASICRERAGAMRARRSLESPTSSGVAVGSACATSGNTRRRTPVRCAMSLCIDDLRGERGTPGLGLGAGRRAWRRDSRRARVGAKGGQMGHLPHGRYTSCMHSAIALARGGYRSIFTSATRRERIANFEAYWAYSVGHDGEILQDQKDLVKKRDALTSFQAHGVRSRRPLADPTCFYRNHVTMQDD